MIEEFAAWQKPILQILATPPVTPSKGQRYLVDDASATGAWAGHENDIAWYDGAAWQFDSPIEGWAVYDQNQNKYLTYNGSAWVDMISGDGNGDMLKSVYDTDDDGIVDKAEAVDDGAGNSTTAAQVKEAYDRRGSYDADLGCILMDL